MNIELGKMNRLRVVKAVDFGMYLDGGDAGEILLPARYVPEGCSVGDELDVFCIWIAKNVWSLLRRHLWLKSEILLICRSRG